MPGRAAYMALPTLRLNVPSPSEPVDHRVLLTVCAAAWAFILLLGVALVML